MWEPSVLWTRCPIHGGEKMLAEFDVKCMANHLSRLFRTSVVICGGNRTYSRCREAGRPHTTDTKEVQHILLNSLAYQKEVIGGYFLGRVVGLGILVVNGDVHRQQVRIDCAVLSLLAPGLQYATMLFLWTRHTRIALARLMKGQTIMLPILAVNRDPHEFIPERWERSPPISTSIPGSGATC
ncbi:hypothetical protein B0H19DRAFT_1307837 [Mycena capillaripes]|nr:hypothetical protein B0H19DRAFT_1307837 [Mycena capillaripes]